MVNANLVKELQNVLPNGNPLDRGMLYDCRKDGIHPIRCIVSLPFPCYYGRKGLGVRGIPPLHLNISPVVVNVTKSLCHDCNNSIISASDYGDTEDYDDISDKRSNPFRDTKCTSESDEIAAIAESPADCSLTVAVKPSVTDSNCAKTESISELYAAFDNLGIVGFRFSGLIKTLKNDMRLKDEGHH